ncbi:MAG TPA: crosslink repair DNA glycosylase YcaQ family protein, partial [Solirubrobacteraceae bacterium]|nr:crosslink repair DNA glycosylase YcaQ family protein [Solirubrobacteraceae bacterium]
RAAGELAEVRLEGRRAWVLARDAGSLEDPPAAAGVRLLGPGDPLLLGRDRETLLPDGAARKEVWRALGGAGIVLADGRVAGLWRAQKKGKRLVVAVEALAELDRGAVRAEGERLAPHRGCTSVELA